MKFFIFLNSIILLVSSIQLDSADLLSAKCQSKCFRNFELRYINDNIMRKKLKHNIGNECREDFKCNSCILPCKESFEDENDCVLKTCTDAGDKGSCYESCRFIYNSTLTKVGLCPNDKKGKSILVNECSAACSNDGDCPDIQKCCTIGCSRICKKPKIKDIRLLPIPESISVQERKRKRSAVVRWVMKKLIPSHVNTNANMYVIQWRWGIQDDIEKMTGWQTITMKTKNYAILKHVLLPGRYYIFRIAAVNEFGTAGFSNSSNPFKLSKEAKAPNSPTNVTYEVVNFNNYLNEWKYRISWLPPHSDLPVKEYHLSYWESDKMTADMLNSKLVNTQIKRSLGQAILEEEDDDNINENIKKVLILPSYSTKAEIEGLKSNKYYIVELYSTAESNNGLLKGDPAYIVIETNNKNEILTNNNDIKKNDVITYNPYHKPIYQKKINFKAAITAPYFHSGSLHSAVSWENHKLCSPIKRNFSVKVYSKSCQGEDIKGRTNECVYVFGGLKFDCEYIIEVNDENTEVNLFTNTFYTYSCVETNGMNEELCQSYEKSGIICSQLSSTIITCSWPQQTMSISSETLIGYRINLSSRNSPSNLTILPPNQRNVIFKDLSPNTDYLLRIQTVTSQGLGQTYETIFRTSKEEIKNDLPTILELPLESTASSNNYRILILLITLSLVPLIRAIIFI